MLCKDALCLKDLQTNIKLSSIINNVVKIYLQVKTENKTPLIPVFQVILKYQCSEIFVQKYSNNIWLSKLPRIKYEYQYSEENIRIFEHIRIFV